MKTKSILRSKTFWVNLILAIVGIVPEVANLPLRISPEWLGFIVVVANVILRLISQDKVTITGK